MKTHINWLTLTVSRAYCILTLLLIIPGLLYSQAKRPRDYGIQIGIFAPGLHNAITDVPGVRVGHQTLIGGDSIRTGVTALIPHGGNLYQQKVPAAIYVGNGYGKLTAISQVQELGTIETPIILTNTLSVPTAANALIGYMLEQPGNEQVQSVNPVVGETNDGYLNDIRGRHVQETDVLAALDKAQSGPVAEGNIGAGTGTVAFGFKGGIGTASRVLPKALGGYTVGVLVQTNFGGVLEINGVPVAKELGQYPFRQLAIEAADGSCMIVVMTNAPVDARNLERLAKRAMLGLGKTGGIASNGSGDYVIALSTAADIRVAHEAKTLYTSAVLHNEAMTPLFLATIEATEEAIINSLFAAKEMQGINGHTIPALPVEEVLPIMRKFGAIAVD